MKGILRTNKKFKLGDTMEASLGRFKFIKTSSIDGSLIEDGPWIKNMIMKKDTHGVNLIVREMIGDHTYSIEITHAKIGTGAGAITETDDDLQAAQNLGGGSNPSILRGDQSIVSINIAHFEFFISNADLPNGTYTRWGLFTGTFGVNEKIFTHAAITPSYSKASNQDTTAVHEVTINN